MDSSAFQKLLINIDQVFLCLSSAFCVQDWAIYVYTRPSNDGGNDFLTPCDFFLSAIFSRQTCIERVWKWKHHVRHHAAHSLNPHWNLCTVSEYIKNHWYFLNGTHLYTYCVVDHLIVIVHMTLCTL